MFLASIFSHFSQREQLNLNIYLFLFSVQGLRHVKSQ